VNDTRSPVTLRDALESWMARTGVARRFDLARAVVDWPDVVGPQIAAVTRARGVSSDGTLVVRVANHAWATELGLMTPRILTRLNGSHQGRVLHIRWQVGPLDGP
jgi:predicted nucleic acid-binding Zn ribbon protein